MKQTLLSLVLLLLVATCLHAQVSAPGSIQGIVVDATGATIQNAIVILQVSPEGAPIKVGTDSSGAFSSAAAPGKYSVTISANRFADQQMQASVNAGQVTDLGHIQLTLAVTTSTIQVTPYSAEAAAAELRIDEQQRVFGAIPNYLVTYRQDAPPLNKKQKYQLTFKLIFDPAAFIIAGAIAGFEQADNGYPGYGQGASGYGLRYGASYGNFFLGSVIGSAILPSLLKQDPRYFVKGQGPVKHRILYALANSVIRKSDSGHWQPDYSGLIGNLAAGGIANAYLPSADRSGASETFENAGIGIAAGAAVNLLQEFVFRKITPKPGNTQRN